LAAIAYWAALHLVKASDSVPLLLAGCAVIIFSAWTIKPIMSVLDFTAPSDAGGSYGGQLAGIAGTGASLAMSHAHTQERTRPEPSSASLSASPVNSPSGGGSPSTGGGAEAASKSAGTVTEATGTVVKALDPTPISSVVSGGANIVNTGAGGAPKPTKNSKE